MELQIKILQYLESIRTESLTLLMTVITSMVEILFVSMVIAILYWCIDKEKSRRLAWIVFLSAGINSIIKNIIKMPRPFQVGVVSPVNMQTSTSYAFPSGHTQSATSFWGGSMLILKSKPVIIIGCIMIALTGLSRMYLGVHWPTDVLGGILFGILSILLANSLINEKGEIGKWHVMGTSVAVIVVLIFDLGCYREVASLWGFTIGAYLEEKYINFKVVQPFAKQVQKVIIGLIGVVIVYVGLKKIFPSYEIFDMIRYAITVLWIVAGAPYCFKKFIKEN